MTSRSFSSMPLSERYCRKIASFAGSSPWVRKFRFKRPHSPVIRTSNLPPPPIFICKFEESGLMVGFSAMSAPEDAIASASTTRFALLEDARRELMLSAQAITRALSRNSAQSDKSRAAPASDFDFAKGVFIKIGSFNMVFVAREQLFPMARMNRCVRR